ncbi:MAG: MBL fold metallo-hydrolase [Bacteroidota bacterium]
MIVKSIIVDRYKSDGGACFGVVPKTIWSKFYPSDEQNLITLLTRILYIVDGDRKILIDSGMGRKRDVKFYKYKYILEDIDLIEELNKINVKPEDITDIIFTHLHDDHVGGASYFKNSNNKIEPYFINAKYWVTKKQWNHAHNPNKREAASYYVDNLDVLENTGNVNFITASTFQFTENILLEEKNGHTPGLLIAYLKYKEQTLVYTADFIPSFAHIPIPYLASYDIEPIIVMEEKEKFLKKAVENNYILVFEHDPLFECCKVMDTERGFKNGEAQLISNL